MEPDDRSRLARKSQAALDDEGQRSALGRAFAAIYENDILFAIAVVVAILVFLSL